jgi:YVTN family beta-propeller protein
VSTYRPNDPDNSAAVIVIDTVTNNVVATVFVGGSSGGIAATPDGSKTVVSSNYFSSSPFHGAVVTIDDASNAVAATSPPILTGVGEVEITPNGARAWVARGTGISIIDIASGSIVDNIELSGPRSIAFNEDGTLAYVTSSTSLAPFGDKKFVFVIDVATKTVIKTIPVGNLGFSGLAVNGESGLGYISTENNTVTVVALPT